MSEKTSIVFVSAFIASAILVCGAAPLFPLMNAGRGQSKSRVELPAWMPTNVAQVSTYAKSAKPTAHRQIDPQNSPRLPTPLDTTDPDFTASIPSQPETITGPDAVVGPPISPPETDWFSAEHGSAFHTAIGEANVSSTPAAAAVSSLSEAALGPTPKPTASAAKVPDWSANASPYDTRVWAALARHKPKAVQRGSTTVTFEIDASGALGSARVDQSSGNARLDKLALQTVHDSAPFPLPPNGASSYTIRIDFQ